MPGRQNLSLVFAWALPHDPLAAIERALPAPGPASDAAAAEAAGGGGPAEAAPDVLPEVHAPLLGVGRHCAAACCRVVSISEPGRRPCSEPWGAPMLRVHIAVRTRPARSLEAFFLAGAELHAAPQRSLWFVPEQESRRPTALVQCQPIWAPAFTGELASGSCTWHMGRLMWRRRGWLAGLERRRAGARARRRRPTRGRATARTAARPRPSSWATRTWSALRAASTPCSRRGPARVFRDSAWAL